MAHSSRMSVAGPPSTRCFSSRGKQTGGVVAGAFMAVLLGGCSMFSSGRNDRREITAVLEKQDAAWNEGDLVEFMDSYWKSPDLTFSAGGSVTRGWQDTYDRYKTRYPDRKAMGKLRFNDLEITFPSRTVALVLGRWGLEGEKASGGAFTLVMKRDHDRWFIVHDHTSVDSR
ncbi:MAG: nuclear transport factor 2 family protein [Planctomycetota bacterium]